MMPFPTLDLAKAYVDELHRQAHGERLAHQVKARDRRGKDHPVASVEPVQPMPLRRRKAARKARKAA